MKKSRLFLIVIITCIITIALLSIDNHKRISGTILLKYRMDNNTKICLFDCQLQKPQHTFTGTTAIQINKEEFLICRYDSLYVHNINTSIENKIYQGKPIEWMSQRNNQEVSFNSQNEIYLLDLRNSEVKLIISDNSSQKHDWSSDGSTLYYSNVHGIISYELDTRKIDIICKGNHPLISSNGMKMAFLDDKHKLYIRDMNNGEMKMFRDIVYNYGFGDENIIFIETSLSMGQFVYGILFDKEILSNRIVSWNYTSNHTTDIIKYYPQGIGQMIELIN